MNHPTSVGHASVHVCSSELIFFLGTEWDVDTNHIDLEIYSDNACKNMMNKLVETDKGGIASGHCFTAKHTNGYRDVWVKLVGWPTGGDASS